MGSINERVDVSGGFHVIEKNFCERGRDDQTCLRGTAVYSDARNLSFHKQSKYIQAFQFLWSSLNEPNTRHVPMMDAPSSRMEMSL